VKKYFSVLLCLLAVGCSDGDKKIDPPANLVPREKMVDILIEIHIAESKVIQRNLRTDSAQLYFAAYKDQIYKKNGVREDDFRKSYLYYMDNIKDMDEIYSVVVDSLSLRESRGRLN
jgi:hypothetical protein